MGGESRDLGGEGRRVEKGDFVGGGVKRRAVRRVGDRRGGRGGVQSRKEEEKN